MALPCRQATLAALSDYISRHDVLKPSIWPARDAVLPVVEKLAPVNVGIWDSGVDIALFGGRLYMHPASDQDDPHGIAFDVNGHATHGALMPLSAQQQSDYTSEVHDMSAMGELQAGMDTAATSAYQQKVAALSPAQMSQADDENEVIGTYMHSTHVAGIASRGNPVIRLAYARIIFDVGNPAIPPTEARIHELARSNTEAVRWFREHRIRVVNMSRGDTPASCEKDLADNGIGKTAVDRKKLARHYFDIEGRALYAALKSAPEILFVTSASNSNTDNQFEETIPSSFKLPNLITVGALDQAGNETNFSSYGSNVLVDAEGLAVESVVPGGAKVRMSGTSMAAPQVTNLAAKLLAIDPKLSPAQLIMLIRKGSDTSTDGRLHRMNPQRSVQLLASNVLITQ